MWVTSKAGLQWNFRVYRYSPCSKKHLLQTKATSFHQCVPSAYLVAECTCNSKGSCCRAAVNRQYANMHMFWHPPTALHLPTLQLYVTNNYSWIDVFAWTLANCWLACGPGAPKPLAKQRKAGLKVSNDAKKEKRPKKYLGFSIILACGSFQRTCETSLQTWEEIETSAESILRASLITGFPSKKHWNRDRRIIVEPAAPLCFSANILEHLVVCHSPSGMLQGCNSRGQFSMFEARQAQMWAWKQVRSIKRKWTRDKRTMRRNPECTPWPPTYCLASCSPQSHTLIFSNFNNNFMNLRSWWGTLKEHAEISLPHWLEPEGVGCLVRMSPHP